MDEIKRCLAEAKENNDYAKKQSYKAQIISIIALALSIIGLVLRLLLM